MRAFDQNDCFDFAGLQTTVVVRRRPSDNDLLISLLSPPVLSDVLTTEQVRLLRLHLSLERLPPTSRMPYINT